MTRTGKAFAAALMLWGLALIVPDVWRVFVEFGTIGLQVNNDGVVYTAPEGPARDSGIQQGDRVDLRRMACPGPSCGDLLSVVGGMGGVQYLRLGHPVRLRLISRRCPDTPGAVARSAPAGRCAFAVTLDPVAHRLGVPERAALLLDELLGVFFIGLAGALLWQRPSAMTWGFFLYALWFNPGQTFVAYANLQRYPTLFILQEAAQGLAQAAGYVGFVVFALSFPGTAIEPRWRRISRALPYLAGVLAALQLASFGATFGIRSELVTRASYLAGYAVDALVVVVLWLRLRSQTLKDRQRMRWVMWSCVAGLPAFILADSLSSTSLWGSWSPPETIVDLLYLLNAGIAVAVYHAVRWHRVVDVRFALSRAATLLATWVLVGIVLVLGARMLEEVVAGLRVQQALLVALVVGLTLVFEHLHDRLNRLCDRLFFRRLHRAAERLRRVETTLPEADSPAAIDAALIGEVVATLRLEAAAVYVRRRDGAFEPRVPGINWQRAPRTLPADDSLVAHLETMAKPVRLERIGWPRDGWPADAPRPSLAVPILSHRALVAIGLYGAHATGDDLNAEEVSMLAQLARAAGAAYDHVEVRLLRAQLDALRRGPEPSRAERAGAQAV